MTSGRAGRAPAPVRVPLSHRERGSATVMLLAVVAVALALALAAVALARVAHARGTAQAAADLAAIAAAEAAQRPLGGDPCAVAARVVAANGADLTGCTLEPGGFVTVSTAVVVAAPAGWQGTTSASARAGPAL